jgi:hypothetical protein
MHVLHLIRINAKSGEDALSQAEIAISDWGDEDNWRSFFVAFDRTGKATWEPGQKPDKDPLTLARLTADLRREIAECAAADGSSDGSATGDYFASRKIAARASAKWALDQCGMPEAFDPWRHDFRSHEFDEFGVTHIELHADRGAKDFIVCVDMHT